MAFMAWIIEAFNGAGEWFYQLYIEAYFFPFPFSAMATWFYRLAELSYDLAWYFYYFSEWVSEVQGKIVDILSWDTIWSYILSYVPNLEDLRDWFYNWAGYVWGEVDDWWTSTMGDVLAWVADAKQYAYDLVAGVNTWLTTLQASWDDFKGRIPTIDGVISWWSDWTGHIHTYIDTWWTGALLEVQVLINTAFVTREQFWDGWQDWRDKVTEFFTDPEQWLYNRLDAFFERFW